MSNLSLSIFLIMSLFAGSVVCKCQYTNGYGQYSGGCYENCIDFATVGDAMIACDASVDCNAITFSQKDLGGSGATNALGNGWGYQLRSSSTGAKSPNKENSWFKGTCPDPNYPNKPCDFYPNQGTYLAGCSLNCIDYSTLSDAFKACRSEPTCGGVTFSKKEDGGSASTNAFDGVWGFQLRAGNKPYFSPNGEDSWTRIACPITQCQYTYGLGQYSGGCYDNCIDYATIDAAKAACDLDQDCKAITFSKKEVGGSFSTNAIGNGWGYQLRSSSTGQKSPNGENSWFKGTCPDPKYPNYPCDYQPRQGTYLAGCSLDCIDYSTLGDAFKACRSEPTCGGITFSKKEDGGSASTNAFDGVWGFQLRAGNIPYFSPNGEDSWIEVACQNS